MPIDSVHPAYAAKRSRWSRQRDAYEGIDVVRARGATYLPRPSGFHGGDTTTHSEYGAYLNRAKWYDACYRTTTALVGTASAKPPTIQGAERIEWQFEDITLSGVSLPGLVTETLRELVLVGRYGIMLMWAENRPKWVGYNTERIRNWHTDVVDGKLVLTRVVLEEDWDVVSSDGYGVEIKKIYRDLSLEDGNLRITTWQEHEATPMAERTFGMIDDEIPLRNGRPLDFIPFVIINSTSVGPAIEKGVTEGLVDASYAYFRHSADYEHGLHLTALPTGVITGYQGDSDLYVGSSTFMQIPAAEARVYFLEFHGHGLGSHERAMETDKAEMASIGARLLEPMPETQETLGAYRMRHFSDTGSLRNITECASEAYTWLLRRHAWWARATEDVNDPDISITLNKDFVATRITPQEIQTLMQALNDGRISFNTWFWNLKQGEVIPPDVDIDTERELIDMEAPARIPLFTTVNGVNGVVATADQAED